MAVNRDAGALQWVKNQTPEICIAAVSRCGPVLSHVREQTLEICRAAVNEDRHCEWLVQPQFRGALNV